MKHRILWAIVGCLTGILIALSIFNFVQLNQFKSEVYLNPVPSTICYEDGSCISGESSFRYYNWMRYPSIPKKSYGYYEEPWIADQYGSRDQYIIEQYPGGYRIYRNHGYYSGEGYYPESGYYPRQEGGDRLPLPQKYPENYSPSPDFEETVGGKNGTYR